MKTSRTLITFPFFAKLLLLLLLLLLPVFAKRAKSSKHSTTSTSDEHQSSSFDRTRQTTQTAKSSAKSQKFDESPKTRRNVPSSTAGTPLSSGRSSDNTIEDVDEDKIDEIIRDATKNLVIFFYDSYAKCPSCAEALSEVEEIDDDIEATGYIEVVKTDDRNVARELGVATFPALVYFRRKHPITYDGDFKDSEVVLRWLRSHEEVVTWELTDDNFEDRTDSYTPDEGSLDWFVMFFNEGDADCNSFVSAWETVAHKLRGLVHLGKVDMAVNDDVSERFRLDSDQCPTFLLFHRGKMYRYKDAAKDIRGLTAFAMHKFKEQRGHRVPEPPTALEQLCEQFKERIASILDDSQAMTVIGVGGLIAIVASTIYTNARRKRLLLEQQQLGGDGDKTKTN